MWEYGVCKLKEARIAQHNQIVFEFLAHLSQRLSGELIGWDSSRRPCVCLCVRVFRGFVCALTISNMNISDTRGSMAIKFYLKNIWGGESLQ